VAPTFLLHNNWLWHRCSNQLLLFDRDKKLVAGSRRGLQLLTTL
jgi:hypothetical protein